MRSLLNMFWGERRIAAVTVVVATVAVRLLRRDSFAVKLDTAAESEQIMQTHVMLFLI